MAGPTGLADIRFMNGRKGIVMAQDAVFCVAVIAERKFFARSDRFEGEVDVLLIFLCFFRMAASTVHIDEAFSEVKNWIGISMAVHAGQFASIVDVPGPTVRIDI